MTDSNKNKAAQENLSQISFKDKILADLEKATQERHRKREEWQQQALSQQKAVAENTTIEELDEVVEPIQNAGLIDDTLDETTKESYFVKKSDSNLTDSSLEDLSDVEELPKVESVVDENFSETELKIPDEEPVLSSENDVETENQLESSAISLENTDLEATKELSEVREMSLPDNEELDVWKKSEKNSEDKTEKDIEDVGDKEVSRENRQKTNRLAAKISTVFVSFLVLAILIGGFLAYRYVSSAIRPLDSKSTEYVQVEIPSGSGNKLIGNILEENGVIKDSKIFNFYTKFKNYTNFQSGYYNFQKSMSLDDIAKYLQKGGSAEPERPALGKVVIPEGYTLQQISQAITLNANTEDAKDKTPFSTEEFISTVQDEAFIAEMVEKYPKLLGSLPEASEVKYLLEGYLFPATYDYYEETDVKALVEQMLAAMDSNLALYYDTIANNGLTVNQVLTLASLVEKEGATDDDRKMIASVFYNRWNIGQPLQSNIAILYAMDKLGEKTTLVEDATIDTSIDSPYNIYANTGLMPGPVDSPSLSALVATIKPADTNYYYFVADVTTGIVYFAEEFEEHTANVEKYVNSKLQ